ncbi:hypothetical protein [Trichococcus collinsii]|uniref:Lipoprotein n=1 Tax=Trichococcus collinsii TaxID=157076 RepID=A0AB38A0Q9_9LACT|nr:hypothetical protein [Trichococcus collinsii]CZQ90959.1 Hypothetical protein Tcol_1053 [Trichococcus collinsii]SEA53292.1 hypothetical protein SAMN04488525_103360 [Trichococcus collinsii]
MKRKIALIGTLTAISVFLTACVQDGTASNESSGITASSQSERIESIAGSDSQASTEADTSISSTHLADPYFAIFASKQYVAQYHFQELTGDQLEDRSMTVAVDGADKAIRISGANTDMTYLTLNGLAYEIDHLNQTIARNESADPTEEAKDDGIIEAPPFKDIGSTYVGSWEDGNLIYEEYYAANGDRMFYYFEGDVLQRIRSASGENQFNLDVIDMSDTVAPEYFALPENYEMLP